MTRAQIEEQFKGIDGINEAKKIYKELAKKLHPDVGGTDELFKILNAVYNHILEHGLSFSEDAEFDLELEKVISKILHYENIIIEVVGSWIWLSGDTKHIKETLKELNFKWASKKKMWYYGEMKGRNPKQKSMDDIKAKYGCQTVKTKGASKVSWRVAS
ncbi:MAG: J domain-containing protein [Sulfurimonas sp.]|uniref:J domain-containing protein n=1 Tax=Sulfurimonas sp. TaxID=2022749 RepID=UPI0028CF82D7|nr:J domain-containing protein [Sulfurimonas sp.]MDT8338873.1 J domain-containing protein [Sulfurimonas sp.]